MWDVGCGMWCVGCDEWRWEGEGNEVCERGGIGCQDGRVVKAVDLSSTGGISAWVRTPLLAWVCACVSVPV